VSAGSVTITSKAEADFARNILGRSLFCAFKEKQMLQDRSIAVFLAMVLFSAQAWAQTPAFPQSSSRPASELGIRTPQSAPASAAAVRFREIASELATSKSITGSQADQAIILLRVSSPCCSDWPPATRERTTPIR
jgi:hypothetical protein